jgi:GrpB-like predicted nucleotidyltransferase (UPF0157 family)
MLETTRLILRPFKESDVEAAHLWFSDPEVFRFYTYGPHPSLEETAACIRKYIDHFERYGYGRCIAIERSSGAPIGDAGLRFSEETDAIAIGYKFAKSHWGKGYATEAADAWVKWGFQRLHLERIIAFVHPQNTGSKRVLDKLGFSLSAKSPEDDWETYQRLRTEYERDARTEEPLRRATIGEPEVINGSISIVDYDPVWPALFRAEADRVRAALGARVLRLAHVGSTSVPGLAAKPIIDMLLVVADSSDEATYVPDLEAAGYVLRIREPDWYQHRLFKGPDADINLHCVSGGCPEIERMLLFRDWLRRNEHDRRLYERTKRELASKTWKYVQSYADAKTAVVEEILARARNGSSE